MIRLVLVIGLLLVGAPAWAEEMHNLKREIIALYSEKNEDHVAYTSLHRKAEMPLNYLGLALRYWNMDNGLPPSDWLKNARGVISWFPGGTKLPDPHGYMLWLEKVLDSGRRVVIINDAGFMGREAGQRVTPIERNRVLRKLGLETNGNWVDITYDVSISYQDDAFMGFERPVSGVLHPYAVIKAARPEVRPLLAVKKASQPDNDSLLVALTPNGGYIAEDYAVYDRVEDGARYLKRQWYVNPFAFFREAFDTDSLPKPDPTTLAGRRIFYSHIDGDGWNNITEISAYRKTPTLSAEVILHEIIRGFPQLPFTVGAIAADLDKDWAGSNESQRIAREIFAEPNVEPASHTYSHPFYWQFFAGKPAEVDAREKAYLSKYPFGSWRMKQAISWLGGDEEGKAREKATEGCDGSNPGDPALPEVDARRLSGEMQYYDLPRAFANAPYDVDMEISGAVAFLKQFIPRGKEIRLLQWSGDTLPYECAVAKSREAGLLNINGGDTRFDREYPSYAWVAPIGRQVGNERQIYASNSNENTYTENWTDRYYGFQFLLKTSANTETPMRLKPFNVYYHMYSGEKLASLGAVRENLKAALHQNLHHIYASQYAAVAQGFYTTRLKQEGENAWRVLDRGALQTLRFDRAVLQTVDYERSVGVVGHRPFQGVLYVYMDASVAEPLVALKDLNEIGRPAAASRPYLIESSAGVANLHWGDKKFSFIAEGVGRAELQWALPWPGVYKGFTKGNNGRVLLFTGKTNDESVLTLFLDHPRAQHIEVEWAGETEE